MYLSSKLADLGYKTSLIEQEQRFAAGPSTKNEGWLHRGTIHSTCIADEVTASQVAKRCIYGHDEIRRFVPEALQDIDQPSICLLNKYDNDIARDRWEKIGVHHRSISLSELQRKVPNVNVDNVSYAYEVADVAINSRIFYRKLLQKCIQSGVQCIQRSTVTFENPSILTARGENSERKDIMSKMFIHTTGIGARQIFEHDLGVSVPFRYWKAHLLVSERLSQYNLFYVEPNEAGLMNHGNRSIVGFNEDEVQCEDPNFTVIPEKAEWGKLAVLRMLKFDENFQHEPVACIKIDVEKGYKLSPSARSVNMNIFEPTPNHICALPGKMTETPYMVDQLIKLVFERIDDLQIMQRPCDK